jgi:16S rRNA A1518/A1519 N6-dimethyltransferase RsmA/KsgA/DIM1 with predicted DNA glycosylase/AP lyase activity
VKAGFAHKRKYVVRNLETVLSSEEIVDTWKRFGLDPKVRAEDLKVGDWINIAMGK